MLPSARAAWICQGCVCVPRCDTHATPHEAKGPPGRMLVPMANSLCCREPPHQPQRCPYSPHCACAVTVMRAAPSASGKYTAAAHLGEVERARQEPAEARRHEGLLVGGPRQEERGRVAVPLVADAHEGRVGARRQLRAPRPASAAASTCARTRHTAAVSSRPGTATGTHAPCNAPREHPTNTV